MSTSASGNGASSASGVQSVDRALTVLSMLARDGELGVTEIAAQLGVHKSTAFRLVGTLGNHDLVEQTADRGKFRLGVGVLRLAGATRVRLDLVQESRAVAIGLAQTVGETINIVMLSGHEALYLDQVAGPSALQLRNWVGQRIPLHASSNGKVLLAYAQPERFEEMAQLPLQRFTDRTITDLPRLRAELAAVRERGYATAIDEFEVGLTAVAAPIAGVDGTVVASVSASGPTFRIAPDRLPFLIEQVLGAATQISRRLGWTGSMSHF
jgi:DNA-binding IclR family transcriptional regulator